MLYSYFSIGAIFYLDCASMAVDNWTINLECDGKAEGHKYVQREMDRDEICFFELIDLIEGSTIYTTREKIASCCNRTRF